MNYCPVCGNVEPDYKCNCIEEATGKKPGAPVYPPVVTKVAAPPKSKAQIATEWNKIYTELIEPGLN